jgi:hypothetical protein
LKASARLSGVAIEVNNDDSEDWFDTKLTVNEEYDFHVGVMGSGTKQMVGQQNFTKGDGTRFNLRRTKPK